MTAQRHHPTRPCWPLPSPLGQQGSRSVRSNLPSTCHRRCLPCRPTHAGPRYWRKSLLFTFICATALRIPSAYPSDPPQPAAHQRLEDLAAWIDNASDPSPRLPPSAFQTKRREILALLSSKEGPEIAEPLLVLLQRLGPHGDKPAPPKFPFDEAAARRFQKDYAESLGLPVEFVNRLGMTFVLVPPGTFLMGSPKDEPGHGADGFDETLHSVTLTRPFYLSKFETTVGQFRRFVEAVKFETDGEKNGGGNAHDEKAVWKHRPGTQWRKPGFAGPYELKDTHPVVHVSHTDSLAFCRWLGEQAKPNEGGEYGLPTEAQWEWACRAGGATRYWWGAEPDTTGKVANVGDRTLKRVHPDWPRAIMPMDDGHAFPAPVGSYRPNAFGLCDMLGNVWEFCSTRSGPYPRMAVTDPGDLDPKRGFAVRGGGWSNHPLDARSSTRNADPPRFCHSNLGFRVALTLPGPAAKK